MYFLHMMAALGSLFFVFLRFKTTFHHCSTLPTPLTLICYPKPLYLSLCGRGCCRTVHKSVVYFLSILLSMSNTVGAYLLIAALQCLKNTVHVLIKARNHRQKHGFIMYRSVLRFGAILLPSLVERNCSKSTFRPLFWFRFLLWTFLLLLQISTYLQPHLHIQTFNFRKLVMQKNNCLNVNVPFLPQSITNAGDILHVQYTV